jgi:hypothetical protein
MQVTVYESNERDSLGDNQCSEKPRDLLVTMQLFTHWASQDVPHLCQFWQILVRLKVSNLPAAVPASNGSTTNLEMPVDWKIIESFSNPGNDLEYRIQNEQIEFHLFIYVF